MQAGKKNISDTWDSDHTNFFLKENKDDRHAYSWGAWRKQGQKKKGRERALSCGSTGA